MRKVHYIKPGLSGLFQHFRTYCEVSVDYLRDCIMVHYRTRAKFEYTNDPKKVTCKTCRGNMK